MTSTVSNRHFFVVVALCSLLVGSSRSSLAQESSDEERQVIGGDIESGLQEIAGKLAERLSARDIEKVAVVEFSDLSGFESVLGSFIAEELTTGLLTTEQEKFAVVERQQLNKILEEQSLTAAGLFDAETIAEVGVMLGIQAIITGSIADLGDFVKINARAISVETAQALVGASIKAPKAGIVDTLMRQGVGVGRAGYASRATGASRGARPSDAFFQNAFLRLSVDNLDFSKERDEVTVTLTLSYLTIQELLVALESNTRRSYITPRARMVDEHSVGFLPRDGGIDAAPGINTLRLGGGYDNREHYTSCAPKSRKKIVLTLRGGKAQGEFFTLTINFLKNYNSKASRFYAIIPNIVASQ